MSTLLKPARTFCAVRFCDDLNRLEADIAVIGAPHGTPYKPGEASHAAGASRAVREALSWFSVGSEQIDFDTEEPVFAGARVVDCGDVPGDLGDGAANRARIAEAPRAVLARGAVPLLLVGIDFVEYVPERDPHGAGAQAIARLACNAITAIARQRRR